MSLLGDLQTLLELLDRLQGVFLILLAAGCADAAAEMGLYGKILPRMNDKQDGIEAGRTFLQYCIFDEESCEEGIAGLEAYRKEWD